MCLYQTHHHQLIPINGLDQAILTETAFRIMITLQIRRWWDIS
jgi:hypothetical protein